MVNKDIDVFKLVEEVNKQKRDANKDIDDIYSMLDEIKDVNIDSVKSRVYTMNGGEEDLVSLKQKVNGSSIVKRPSLPNVGNFDSRYNCFVDLINRVDYGESNSQAYVDGHQKALRKYLKEAENNPLDLVLVEGMLSDEMKKTFGGGIDSKGYSDGLSYVYQALRKSKNALTKKLYERLKTSL